MEKVKNGKTRRKLKIISVVFSVALVLAVLVSLPFIFENNQLIFKDEQKTVTHKTEAEGEEQNQVSTASYVEGLTLAQDENGTWYCSLNGAIYEDYEGIVYCSGSWFYVKNGYVDWNYTGIAQNGANGEWYYVKYGRVDWSYTGLCSYNGNWYHIENGYLD